MCVYIYIYIYMYVYIYIGGGRHAATLTGPRQFPRRGAAARDRRRTVEAGAPEARSSLVTYTLNLLKEELQKLGPS